MGREGGHHAEDVAVLLAIGVALVAVVSAALLCAASSEAARQTASRAQ